MADNPASFPAARYNRNEAGRSFDFYYMVTLLKVKDFLVFLRR
jgi:hypothetical protein